MNKRKIAILGGGVGAMTTAAMLTDPANPNAGLYDVTVYQMGWRLGGKGASGRNAARNDRIEEHGLHIWFGSYDNAFRVIRRIYGELKRAPDAPLGGWRQAFKPHSYIAMMEHVEDTWRAWPSALPTNDMLPGEGNLLLPIHDYILMAIKLLLSRTKDSHTVHNPFGDVDVPSGGRARRLYDGFMSSVVTVLVRSVLRLFHAFHFLATLIKWLTWPLIKLVGVFMRWLYERIRHEINSDDRARREWIEFNFFYANIRGALDENVLDKGIDVLNRYDYREFLAKYAVDDGGVMLDSAWVLGIYDGVFAFINGNNKIEPGQSFPEHGKVEAGNVIKAGIRQFFAYKGASIWKMQAGMGDTVFGPMYEVLKARDVKFEFFHKVDELIPTEDGTHVEKIRMSRQAQLKPDQSEISGKSEKDKKQHYDPLVVVKGLPCWPSEPLWRQLRDGEALRASGVDFESYAPQKNEQEQFDLVRGEHFDDIVLGISIGALPYIAGPLIDKSTNWQQAMTHVRTTRTQGCQLWLDKTAYELGWTEMQRPIATAYEVSPFDTWGDMSHLIDHENWTSDAFPHNNAYFCGVMQDDGIQMTKHGPKEPLEDFNQSFQNYKTRKNALQFLNNDIGVWWPDAVDGKTLQWQLLVDPTGGDVTGEARFDSQFWKANVQPSERYVLSVPGSSVYRLKTHDATEFKNLYLSGDWIDNGFNLGCVEAATMGGLLASNALSDYPSRKEIIGLNLGAAP